MIDARFLLPVVLLVACGGSASRPAETAETEARALLDFYYPPAVALLTEANRAAWLAATDVSEEHTGMRAGADIAFKAFSGNARFIEKARGLLARRTELTDRTRRELTQLLALAAEAPGTNPDLARRRGLAEAHQSALLDSFVPCLARDAAGTCTQPTNANGIDQILVRSRDMNERLNAWNASKAVGHDLRPGILELRDLRNGVALEMGHSSFFEFQVSNYGMTSQEMMTLLDRLVVETKPLYSQLHCWAKHELAQRYGVRQIPELLPAHWVGNRWAQDWPSLVDGVDMDAILQGKQPEWIVQQAERFYTSMGFASLPTSFWEQSDLYPIPEGQTRKKNSHATAWHIDLNMDVRSIMSVEPDWRWFTTTHHELGHIYYYMEYSSPNVPPLLREGANRGYHEGMGDLIALAASQEPYLREIGLLGANTSIDQMKWLLDSALTGPITFLPFAAGTMSHFEHDFYAGLPAAELNRRWWEHVARYQGVAPPAARPDDTCDACTKTHINDDPAQYYDYAIANVLVFQLHDHICKQILHQDPRSCNYYNSREVGEFLRAVMRPGMSRDWREVLREHTGRDLTAEPMLEYYTPLLEYLRTANAGRTCTF